MTFWAALNGPVCQADIISEWNRIGDGYIIQQAPIQEERALAMMHLAQFEAVNAVTGGYTPYALTLRAPHASAEAAAVQAAYSVLTNISRANLTTLNAALQHSLSSVPDGVSKQDGIR